MSIFKASREKRTKESQHGISFKYNRKRKSLEVYSITDVSLFAQTSLKEGDEVVAMNGVKFQGNMIDKIDIFMKEEKGIICLLAIRRKKPSRNGWFWEDCFCHCDGSEYVGCCYILDPFSTLENAAISVIYSPRHLKKCIQ